MISVVNKYKGGVGIYIGRSHNPRFDSPLGNPFPLLKEEDRDYVIELYRNYIYKKIAEGDERIVKELKRIQTLHRKNHIVNLVCYCAPLRCHGDIIKEIVETMEFT